MADRAEKQLPVIISPSPTWALCCRWAQLITSWAPCHSVLFPVEGLGEGRSSPYMPPT